MLLEKVVVKVVGYTRKHFLFYSEIIRVLLNILLSYCDVREIRAMKNVRVENERVVEESGQNDRDYPFSRI